MILHLPRVPLLRIVPLRGRAVAARRAHNPEVVGSNPTPATNFPTPMTQIKSIDIEEVADHLKAGDCFLLDVRSPAEFESGHIEGACNIPLLELHLKAYELPLDKELVVYCAHGMRSAKAAHYLTGNGFHKVTHVSGDLGEVVY
jgi:rhodanese-related sulfurtransferase